MVGHGEAHINQHTSTSRSVRPARATGRVAVPSSKSHTIRALLIAGAATEPSTIHNVLESADAERCMAALTSLGATVETIAREETGITVRVTPPAGGMLAGKSTGEPPRIDVGNSGTTLYLLTALAALRPGGVCFDGDESIRRRSAGPLHLALRRLGATISGGREGCAPYCITGPLKPGRRVTVESPTSQYLSALLLTAPVLPIPPGTAASDRTTRLDISLLYERPYIDMTCWWLDRQGIAYRRGDYDWFSVPGGQRYRPVSGQLPGDYSSATFWFCAAAITGGEVVVTGLASDDVQGDRAVLSVLEDMGCSVEWSASGIRVAGSPTRGGSFDLNDMPDALPALAVTACAAPKPVTLGNVPQARAKETDRIAVMAREITTLGGRVEELPDGLVIHPARLHGGTVDSHGDHRVAMAMAVAALGATGQVTITDAAAAAVTYPGFWRDLAEVAPGSLA